MSQPPVNTDLRREVLDVPVLYAPGAAVERWRRLRSSTRWGIGSLVLNAVVWAGLWWFTRDSLWPGFAWMAGISLSISVVLLLWSAVRLKMARRDLDRLHEGLALGIGRGGLLVEDRVVPWTELTAVAALPARWGGSRRLVVHPAEGPPATLPLDYLGHSPAAIDNAVRALSGGRVGVDLSRLDD